MRINLTLLLILTNIAVFAISSNGFVINEKYALEYGFSINNFLNGNYHTLITSFFLHADIYHLVFNMIALFFLGLSLESKVKKSRYLTAYFLGGIIGNLSVFIPIFGYTTESISVGASAAISALVGLGTFVCPGRLVIFGSLIPIPFVLAGAIYFLFTLSMLFEASQIAYPAHLFGMIAGSFLGFVWGKKRIKRLIIFISICILIILLPYLIELFL
ncbi:MAG: rhomboid family intramembrane serine protease [Candidatus Aenigmatarchaeota archaeon]